MNKSILHLLSTAALLAAVAAPAFADTVYGTDVAVTVNGFTPISSTGNSFTFSGYTYTGDGFPNGYLYKNLFAVDTLGSKTLTGKMSFSMELQYQFETPPPPQGDNGSYSASTWAIFSMLAPLCGPCGTQGAEPVGSAEGGTGASATSPTSGTMSFTSSVSNATGSYDHLLGNLIHTMWLNPAYGSLTITSLTLSFDTANAASPVPELPPYAMMGAGLGALGLCARLKGRKKQGNEAIAA